MNTYHQIFEQRGVLYNAAHAICPESRRAEADALLKWLCPRAYETIAVIAAGGGFDACAISQHLHGKAKVICVEPSRSFSKMIPDHLDILNAPIHDIPLEDASVDAVVNLATLHHVADRDRTFHEWDRLLKPGGRMIIGDVEKGSENAEFLNTAVDRYTPGGHKGDFLKPHELTDYFSRLGYEQCQEGCESYTWRFESKERMSLFTMLLFGMVKADFKEIEQCLATHVGFRERSDGVTEFPWSLRFFSGIKVP
ncbi:MAG: class I SAM-dependent methyltransferase [Rubripirellula sp.]